MVTWHGILGEDGSGGEIRHAETRQGCQGHKSKDEERKNTAREVIKQCISVYQTYRHMLHEIIKA